MDPRWCCPVTSGCTQTGLIAPTPDADSATWWQALAQGRFALPRCRACGKYSFPPQDRCPHCRSTELELVDASGRGRVYSWVVVHRALDEAFSNDVPYTIVAVDLEEGPRMFGRLCVDGRIPRADDPVRALIYEVQGQKLVGFELGHSAAGS